MKKVIVGMSTCGISAGAQLAYDRLSELLQEHPGSFELSRTGCISMCYREPLVEIRENNDRIFYGEVTPKLADEIYRTHIEGGRVLDEHVALRIDPKGKLSGQEEPFHALQKRVVLRNCGTIDPESIEEYIAAGGYKTLKKALIEMDPLEIIDEVKVSGLRGRGGGGFLAGKKWQFCREA
jgi:NADH-quinone oxidoreductase subunit F